MDPSGEVTELIAIMPLAATLPIQMAVAVNSVSIILLLVLSFLITGGEHALFSLKPSELAELERNNHRIFGYIKQLIARPRHLLVLVKMFQMMINVTVLFLAVNIGIHLFAGTDYAWIKYILEIVILILLLLVFQEIMPKFFGGKNNLLWARVMGAILFFLGKILYPFTEFIIESSHLIEKRFTRENGMEEGVMEKQEEQLAEESEPEGEAPILSGILKFRTIVVRQIMRSRLDMFCVNENLEFQQLLKIVRETLYSRLPVYRENLDHIIGILYTKDLLTFLQEPKNQDWHQLLREAYFVPEGKKISEVLLELQRKQQHLAIVIDEYGRTAGLLTLEDIIEEIIGEVRDETDERFELEYTQLSDDTYVFEGKTPLNDFCRVMGIFQDYFDEVKGDADSIGGLILQIRGTIPQPEETVEYQDFLFTVLALTNYRITRVKVTRKSNVEASESS